MSFSTNIAVKAGLAQDKQKQELSVFLEQLYNLLKANYSITQDCNYYRKSRMSIFYII